MTLRWVGSTAIFKRQTNVYNNSYITDLFLVSITDRWQLRKDKPSSCIKLIRALFGLCVHCTTDIAPFDMTIQSQMVWDQHLVTRNDTFYLSVVGINGYSMHTRWIHKAFYFLRGALLRSIPKRILGIDFENIEKKSGFDGMLFASEQSRPRLYSHATTIACQAMANNMDIIDHIDQVDDDCVNVDVGVDVDVDAVLQSPSLACSANRQKDDRHPHIELTGCENVPCSSNLHRGCWYVLHRDMDHVGVNSDDGVWPAIFDAITKFDALSHISKHDTNVHGNSNGNGNTANRRPNNSFSLPINSCVNSRPDMQLPIWPGKPDTEVHLSMSYKMIYSASIFLFAWNFVLYIYATEFDAILGLNILITCMTIGVSIPLTAFFLFQQKYSMLVTSRSASWMWTSDDVETCGAFFRIVLCVFLLIDGTIIAAASSNNNHSSQMAYQAAAILLSLSYPVETLLPMWANVRMFDYFVPITKVLYGMLLIVSMRSTLTLHHTVAAVAAAEYDVENTKDARDVVMLFPIPLSSMLLVDGIILLVQAVWTLVTAQPIDNNNHNITNFDNKIQREKDQRIDMTSSISSTLYKNEINVNNNSHNHSSHTHSNHSSHSNHSTHSNHSHHSNHSNRSHPRISSFITKISASRFQLFWLVHWLVFLISCGICVTQISYHLPGIRDIMSIELSLPIISTNIDRVCPSAHLTNQQWQGQGQEQGQLEAMMNSTMNHTCKAAFVSESQTLVCLSSILAMVCIFWMFLQKFRSMSEVYQITTLQRFETWF